MPQNEIGVMTRIVDVVKHRVATKFAGVIDDDVPKPDAGECFDCRYFCLAMQYPSPSFDVFGLPGCLVSY